MDKKSSLTQMKPLSYADQSNNERELPQNGNSSTKEEVLILPKASSDRAPKIGLVERFNFGLLPRFNLSLVARFNFGLPNII